MEQDECSFFHKMVFLSKNSNREVYFFAGLLVDFTAAGLPVGFAPGFFLTTFFFFLAPSGLFEGNGFVPLTGFP